MFGMVKHQQVLVDLGEGHLLSIVQGAGTYSEAGTCEVAVLKPGPKGFSVGEPVGHLDAKALADYIQTYQQDKYYERMFD